MLESPFVGLVEPTRAQKLPLWQPLLTTDDAAPDAVHPLRLPVSKPPLTIPPAVAVTLRLTLVVCIALVPVPVTVSVYVPAAAVPVFTVSVEEPPAVTDVGLK